MEKPVVKNIMEKENKMTQSSIDDMLYKVQYKRALAPIYILYTGEGAFVGLWVFHGVLKYGISFDGIFLTFLTFFILFKYKFQNLTTSDLESIFIIRWINIIFNSRGFSFYKEKK